MASKFVIRKGEIIPSEFLRFTLEELTDNDRAATDLLVHVYDETDLVNELAAKYGPLDIDAMKAKGPVGLGVSIMGWMTSNPRPANTPVAPVLIFKPPVPAIASRRIWHGTYAEYTATPEFQQIAAAARKEWNYQCLIDRSHKGRIEMHHRDYRNVPFSEDWRDLIPLCEDCHHLYHGRLLKPPVGLFDEVVQIKAA